MARLNLLTILLCQIITVPILGGQTDDDNPLLNFASSVLQNMGDGGDNMNSLSAIGNIVGAMMQGKNAQNQGSLLGQDKGAGDLLSGLGSLLGGENGKIDPALVGSMVSMFAQSMTTNENKREKRNSNENDIDINSILSLGSSLIGNKNIASYMPLIMNAINSFTSTEAEKKSEGHKDHASFLPPFLEKVHLYWDLFINSPVGQIVWEKSGMKAVLKGFVGPDGNFNFDTMLSNFENQSFRRHWIKVATKYLTDIVMHVSKPEVYQSYTSIGQYVTNTFLDSQGFPKSTHFSAKKPEKSITSLVNYVLKHYMDIDADVSEYVFPAVEYVKKLLKLAEKSSQSMASRNDYYAIADQLTDTLNMDVIEPVLRVYRAYKHSLAAPHCQEHLMCLVNRDQSNDTKGFKVGLTKVSSLAASAALSFQNGRKFWDLYSAIQKDVNCEAEYPADCTAFHEHELKVTTEVYHNEL